MSLPGPEYLEGCGDDLGCQALVRAGAIQDDLGDLTRRIGTANNDEIAAGGWRIPAARIARDRRLALLSTGPHTEPHANKRRR